MFSPQLIINNNMNRHEIIALNIIQFFRVKAGPVMQFSRYRPGRDMQIRERTEMYSYWQIKYEMKRGAVIAWATIQSLLHRKKLFLLGTPVHGNLGDHAIAMAARQFLNDRFPGYAVIEVEPRTAEKYMGYMKKHLIRDGLVLNTGGGSFGSLWFDEERMLRTLLRTCADDRVIILPQTIYFTQDEEGQRILAESQAAYTAHRDLYIGCRERYTYEFMQEHFPGCRLVLAPDMVLYLRPVETAGPREGVLFCMRTDKEAMGYDMTGLERAIQADGLGIVRTSTVLPRELYGPRRFREVRKKIAQFAGARLVVTDRLHGMLFALLAKTPCLVLENRSYKIRGVYEWIRDVDSVRLTDAEHMLQTYRELIGMGEGTGHRDMRPLFDPLAELIGQSLK